MAAAAAFVSSGPSVASVASAAASEEDEDNPTPIRSVDEYSPVVQEMVVNGFELAKVVRAVELIGENFDDLLAFLMSSCAK
jgi:predicted cation transporter